MNNLIDGKAIAAKIHEETAAKVRELISQNIQPAVAFVRVGEDPASYNDTIEGETRQLERQVSHLLRDLEAGQDAREAGQKFLALLTENDSRLKG